MPRNVVYLFIWRCFLTYVSCIESNGNIRVKNDLKRTGRGWKWHILKMLFHHLPGTRSLIRTAGPCGRSKQRFPKYEAGIIKISDSHGGGYEYDSFLGYCAVCSGRNWPISERWYLHHRGYVGGSMKLVPTIPHSATSQRQSYPGVIKLNVQKCQVLGHFCKLKMQAEMFLDQKKCGRNFLQA
jgi:hypothetical protein